MVSPQRETFVDKIVEIIELRISTGELKPNSILSETKIAKEFKVSRGPAREAFFRLEEMGLVVKKHNGRVVKEFSIDEFKENHQLKMIVEAYCCMQGALRASKKEINSIQKILNRTEFLLSSENDKDRLNLTSVFHELMVSCSRNKLLIEIYKKQTKKVGWPRYLSLVKPKLQDGYKQHLEIFAAFAKKDGELVRKLVERHQSIAGEIILKSLKVRAKR